MYSREEEVPSPYSLPRGELRIPNLNADIKSLVVTTGAYGGIGVPAVVALQSAMPNAHVLILGRDRNKGEALASSLNGRASFHHLDLTSLRSVDFFCAALVNAYKRGKVPPIDRVMLAAGVQARPGQYVVTQEGLEETIAVNHLSHHLIATRLHDAYCHKARVVFVSSGTHDRETIEGRFNPPANDALEELIRPTEKSRALSSIRRYSTSKLYNILCAYGLSRRVRAASSPKQIDYLAFDPGAVPGTGLLRSMPSIARSILGWKPLLKLSGVRVEEASASGAALAHAVYATEHEGIGSAYFGGLTRRPASRETGDGTRINALWDASERVLESLGVRSLRDAGFPVEAS